VYARVYSRARYVSGRVGTLSVKCGGRPRPFGDPDVGAKSRKLKVAGSVKTHGRVRFHFLRMGIYTEMVCVFHRSWVLRSDSGRTKKSRNSLSILAETSLGRSHFEGPDLADGDDDGLATESQDRRSGCRRCREHGYIEGGVDQEGHEAEESPDARRPMRARGEEALGVQVVQCLSARSSAP